MRSPIDSRERKEIFSNRESVSNDNYILVRYKITAADGLIFEEAVARTLLIGTLRTMQKLNHETFSERLKHAGRIVDSTILNNSMAGVSKPAGLVELAFPISQCTESEGITQLIQLITSPAEYNYSDSYWIESISFPEAFVKRFTGPKLGTHGIQSIFNIFNRPLIGITVKPRNGSSLNLIKAYCEEALTGGADFIVDDLLLVDPYGELNIRNRINAFTELTNRMATASNIKKYFVNINLPFPNAVEIIDFAISKGVGAILLNPFTLGYGNSQLLINHINGRVAVICTNMGSGIMTRGSLISSHGNFPTGISEAVISKISRLIGADAVHTGTSASECYGEDAWGAPSRAIKDNFFHIKASMPVAEGDLNIVNLSENIRSLGKHILLEPTTGIINYPGGPKIGAKAFKLFACEIHPEMSDQEVKNKVLELRNKHGFIRDGLNAFDYQNFFKL
ncbi:RuBisCO large subunit C-terminal-like domain-containing protein [Mucilaginibacter psychrotolerans]|uniref:Ribulose bisphosphate carboxylase large subunit C-terminal domain-containing protein n=1 Tax=Mucilaginibacter psychrotolerans TaxID=1524096 RepID=A0A4Y8SC91_9SPHI|nr:RuBisCO large subunit C-terminal-like domain-containing protein [Mucilaginibacter psychrotolerans]TFF36200.1 hypothetical protein E2R66_16805 [Mucilaginibacter psychrotolerans]